MDWTILLAGFAGGIIRGLVGYIKYQTSYKNVPFKLWYFLSVVIASGIIGLAAGWVVKAVVELDGTLETTRFYAFVAGYVFVIIIKFRLKLALAQVVYSASEILPKHRYTSIFSPQMRMIIRAIEKGFSAILLRDYSKNTTHILPPTACLKLPISPWAI